MFGFELCSIFDQDWRLMPDSSDAWTSYQWLCLICFMFLLSLPLHWISFQWITNTVIELGSCVDQQLLHKRALVGIHQNSPHNMWKVNKTTTHAQLLLAETLSLGQVGKWNMLYVGFLKKCLGLASVKNVFLVHLSFKHWEITASCRILCSDIVVHSNGDQYHNLFEDDIQKAQETP